MCTPAQCKAAQGSLMDHLSGLSAAEDFFKALDVEFDQAVVSVYRLHILKRFNRLLDLGAMNQMEPAAQKLTAQAALAKAYGEFAAGEGKKDFKVFQDAKVGFVPLGDLRAIR